MAARLTGKFDSEFTLLINVEDIVRFVLGYVDFAVDDWLALNVRQKWTTCN